MAASNSIAQIINGQWPKINKQYNNYQLRIFDAIRRCRTSSLGGHSYLCNQCKKRHHRYNSCRNRHCPQCQNTQKERWIQARQNQFIQCPYYHLVFTLPHQLNEFCLAYPRQMYALLIKAAWQTIQAFGWNHKYLGAQIGATILLHTWGSNLSYHPHVHCIVPGGGITLKGKWKNAKGNGKFLFPVHALSKKFKGIFLDHLANLFADQGLDNTQNLIDQLMIKKWVVYAKSPFGANDGLVRYLARYTHNVAISNHRIISFDEHKVTFRYKDYRKASQNKTMTVLPSEFVRRLSLHFLPKGFCRIRHYGILSSAWKQNVFAHLPKKEKISWEQFWKNKGLDVYQCPHSKKGQLFYMGKIDPVRGPPVYYEVKIAVATR